MGDLAFLEVALSIGSLGECDWIGCGQQRRAVNHWYVVTEDDTGVQIWRWDKCPEDKMYSGKHFCGLAHAFLYASKALTPDTTDVNRESTSELKPLTIHEGKVVEAKPAEEPTEERTGTSGE